MNYEEELQKLYRKQIYADNGGVYMAAEHIDLIVNLVVERMKAGRKMGRGKVLDEVVAIYPEGVMADITLDKYGKISLSDKDIKRIVGLVLEGLRGEDTASS